MPSADIEKLCGEVVPGSGAPRIDFVSAGLVNETYRVIRDGRAFVVRVASAASPEISSNRDWELRVLRVAAAAQLAPALAYCDPVRGVLLSEWLDGRPWTADQARQSGNLRRIAALLDRVHALSIPSPARVMDPQTWIQHYDAVAPPTPAHLRNAAQAHLRRLDALPAVAGVLCHGDVHGLNLLESEHSLTLLDWEYAHVSQPFWDVAGWCANGDLAPPQQLELLQAYVGRAPSAQQRLRLELLIWLYDYICLQWSRLYLSLQRRRSDARAVSARAALLDARLEIPAQSGLAELRGSNGDINGADDCGGS